MVQEVFAALASARSDKHADQGKHEKAGCLNIPLFFYGLASVASEKIGKRQAPKSFRSWFEPEDRELSMDPERRSPLAERVPFVIRPMREGLRGEWT